MRRLMTAALALALMSGTSAMAQPAESSHHGGGGGGGQGGGQRGGAPNAGAPRAGPAAQPQQGGQRGPAGGGAPAYQGGGANRGGYQGSQGGAARQGGYQGYQGGAARQGGSQSYQGGAERPNGSSAYGARGAQGEAAGRAGERSGYQAGARGGTAARGVPGNYHPAFGAQGFRPGGERPHYDAHAFPRTFRPEHAYAWRGGAWVGPSGYYYRHWGYGERLPFGWYDARWYINDYYYYDLPVPPYGYEWVRAGPDALLVDLDDGEVVESVYGLFY